jgi:hypothetical protein
MGLAPTGKRRLSTAHAICGLLHRSKKGSSTFADFMKAAEIPRLMIDQKP